MKNGRHTPAFILLFLREGPLYGAQILSRMEREMPRCFTDSPGLYRALQNLEKEGAVEASWVKSDTGVPTKIYQITSLGLQTLQGFAEDIRLRRENLDFFIRHYEGQDQ